MLKTTLIALLLIGTAVPAMAQAPAEPTPQPQVDPNATSPQDVEPDLETEPLTNRSAYEGFGREFTDPVTVDSIQGSDIYDSAEEKIGTISDLVMNETGQAQDVVVDVGGFLGIGSKSVSLAMDQIDLVQAHEGDEVRGYIDMTREEIEALPESDL